MAKLYTNENVPLPVAEELRRLGHDVMTVQESGLGGQSVPDHAVLKFAIDQGRCPEPKKALVPAGWQIRPERLELPTLGSEG